MNNDFQSERCYILRCLADMAWAEDEAEIEKGYESAREALRKYYDGLVEKLAEKERGNGRQTTIFHANHRFG